MLIFSPVFPALAQEEVQKPLIESPSIEPVQTEPETVDLTHPELLSEPDAKIQQDTELVQEPDASQKSNTTSSAPPAPLPTLSTPSTIKTLRPTTDVLSGALRYTFPFAIPSGRAQLQPDLSLSYNSQDRTDGSIAGFGWTLSVPSITRVNKTGTETLYSSSFFASSMDGELESISDSQFGAKIETGSFLQYTFSENVWIVRDTKGVMYTFGATSASRQDNAGDVTQIFQWMLSEVRDLNDNVVTYEYNKHEGQIYPSRILYTGHGTTPGIFEVKFLYETRPDIRKNYQPAFLVETRERISSILVNVQGSTVRTYTFGYTVGQDGFRSLLTSITESGTDENGVTIERPATIFSYQSQSKRTYTTPPSWVAPFYVTTPASGVLVADVNGDALPDLLKSVKNQTGGVDRETYLNTGSGWETSTDWLVPPSIIMAGVSNYPDYGIQAIDVNADGKVDLVKNHPGAQEMWLNNGAGWIFDSAYSNYSGSFNQDPYQNDQGSRLIDVNGDGLPDWIKENGETAYLQLNSGAGWKAVQSNPNQFNPPMPTIPTTGATFADVNNDGLVDLMYAAGFMVPITYLNTGTGWKEEPGFRPPTNFNDNLGGDNGIRPVDLDNNSLMDLGWRARSINQSWLNSGTSFVGPYTSNWDPGGSCEFASNGYNTTRFSDLNGDGLMDWFCTAGTDAQPQTYAIIDTGSTNDILTDIVFSTGGSTHISYQASALYRDAFGAHMNASLPYTIQTVQSLSHDDGFGLISSETFFYEGGSYYYASAFERKFAGFHTITKTDAEGNTTTSWYHQGNGSDSALGEIGDMSAKAGQVFRTEMKDAFGNLLRVVVNTWENVDLQNNRNFVKLAKSVRLDYTSDSSHQDTATSYVYDDTNGNLLQQIEWGQVSAQNDGIFVDVLDDVRFTYWTYAANEAFHLLDFVASEKITGQDGLKNTETLFYYDDLAFGQVEKGNLTTESSWIAQNNYAQTKRVYNSYGFMTQETDPRNSTTIYTPDAYQLLPSAITNPLGHAQTFAYDYSVGMPKRIVNVNGMITEIDFDGFGRPQQERRSSALDAQVLEITQTWVYNDASFPLSSTHGSFLSNTIFTEEIMYFDGFERVIEMKTLAEDGIYNEVETIYDNLERVFSVTLPEAALTTAYDANTIFVNLAEYYLYDALGRVIETKNILGSTRTVYDGFTKTVFDPLGNQKDYLTDGLDRLVSVVEYLDGIAYTTHYSWDATDQLLSITDAQGNVRNFSYDGRGLRLTAEDLHAPNDSTFGVWVYTFDDAGNLKTSLSPNGITLTNSYDALNRIETEDANSADGIEVTYVYDSCLNGIGQSCETKVNSGAITNFFYDAAGNKVSESVTLDAKIYTTTNTYDRQKNILTTTHPDGTKIINTYNALGKLESTQKQQSSDVQPVFIVSDFDYGPHGQIISQTNANGTGTTYTYDKDARYRLTRKVTTGFKEETNNVSTTTTDRFYPTLGDGFVYKYNSSWDATHDATSGSSAVTTYLRPGTGKSSLYYYIYRAFLPFDTSSIPDDATIATAKLYLYPYSKYNHDNDGDDFITLVQTSQASTATLSLEDYDQAGSINNPTEGIDTSQRKDISAVTLNTFFSFTLNATGRSWISKTGFTKLGLREGHDVIDSAFTSSSTTSSQYNYLYLRSADYSGTTSDPYLEVTYTYNKKTTTVIPLTIQDINYTYDVVGNITKIVDAPELDSAKIVEYVYDDLYRLTSETITNAANEKNTSTTYSYNILGNILYRSDTGTYFYDGDKGDSYANPHAVTSIVKPDGATITYIYDKNGNLTSVGKTTYSWDDKNRLISSAEIETGTAPTTITNTLIFYPVTGEGFVYKYTSSWDSTHDATAGSSAPYSYSYLRPGTGKSSSSYYINRAFLPFDTSSIPDDATITQAKLNVYPYYKYNHDNDGDDFITVVQTSQASTATLSLEDYDQAGSINNPTEGIDPGQRKDLTAISLNAYLPFTLNATGREWISKTGVTKLGLREGHDVLDSAFTSSSTTSSQYNYLYLRSVEYSGTTSDPYLEVTYTQPGETTETTTKNLVTYAYDHGMRRVSKKSETGTTYYPSTDYSLTGEDSTVYVSGPSGLVASIKQNPSTGSGSSMIHTDHLGSTNVVTDETGVVKELLDYHAYGAERLSWSSTNEDGKTEAQKTYIGEYSDDETALSYLNARYYDPKRGQFLGQDPAFISIGAFADERQLAILLDPQLQNSYSYARGNPISMSDASGESPLDTIAGFFVGTAKGAWAMVRDIARTAAHPIAAFNSLMSAVQAIASDPAAAADFLAQYLGNGVREYVFNSTDYERGVMLGALAVDMLGTGKKGFLDDVGRAAIRASDLVLMKAGNVVAGLRVTEHAAQRFIERNISVSQIKEAMSNGIKYYDNRTGNTLHIIGSRENGGYTVITDQSNNTLITVENFVPKLSETRYESLD